MLQIIPNIITGSEVRNIDPRHLVFGTIKVVYRKPRGFRDGAGYLKCYLWTGLQWASITRKSVESLGLPRYRSSRSKQFQMDALQKALMERIYLVGLPVWKIWFSEGKWHAKFRDLKYSKLRLVSLSR